MVRFAHLSDIHVTVWPLVWRRHDWFSKHLTSWINLRFLGRRHRFNRADEVLTILMRNLRQRGVEHVIFSGDATALGFDEEIRRAAELLEVNQRPGLAVPGNHDYCTKPAARSGNFERHFAAWQTGQRCDAHYPFAQRVGPVWLVGVNSATGNVSPTNASGCVGLEQCARLERLLAQLSPGPRLLVTHHPVCLANGRPEKRYHGLRDLNRVVQAASNGNVNVWLHGHRHSPYMLFRNELAPFPSICAGSATQTGLWSYFEYTVDEQRLQGVRRCFDPGENRFREQETIEFSLVPASRAP